MVVHHTPNLLGQYRIIGLLYFLKTHTSNLLDFTKTLPPNPMDFPIVPTIAPPKLTNQGLNFLDQPFWKLKATHGVSGNGLDHGFDEHLSTGL